MSQIQITDLSFRYNTGCEWIFNHTSFNLDTDWKLGFIGRNGKGKTTFLQLLLGKYEYSGKIKAHVSFEYFPYLFNEKQTALYAVRESIAPFSKWEKEMEELLLSGTEEDLMHYGEILELYMAHDGFQINQLIEKEIGKLNLPSEILEQPVSTLSPGEQTKLKLAALFLRKNTFLLIDEPTNHLDMEGRRQLADYLNQKHGFILVSHDRTFLDRCIDHVLSINRTTIEVQKGNYSSWKENKDKTDQFELEKNANLKKDIRRLEEAAKRGLGWADKVEKSKIGNHSADRGFIGAQAARMMQRAKNIEKRREEAVQEKKGLLQDVEEALPLKINILPSSKKRLLTVQNITCSFGDRIILSDFSMELNQGERVAIKGKNGCGKSTLIKLLLGEVKPQNGTIWMANDLRLSYVSQDTSFLKGTLRTFAEMHGLDETLLKTVLFQLDFPREHLDHPMEYYSEGQKKKVLLAKSLIEPSTVFIWDEPLNYVDVLSRIQLEELLLSYKPTMLFVEHDQTFCQKIATRNIQIGA